METWDAIRARRNVRTYTSDPVPEADLLRIAEAGWRAPSANNRQHWDFVVVTDRPELESLSTVWRGAGHIATAAAAIALVIPQYDDDHSRLVSQAVDGRDRPGPILPDCPIRVDRSISRLPPLAHSWTRGLSVASAFSLGWVMAQLFDARRLTIDELFSPPFNPLVQLPLVADLDLARRRELALTDLGDLLGDVAPGVPGEELAAVKAAAADEKVLAATLRDLHQAILDQLVGNDQQIGAYQLGLMLSDTCWLPTVAGGPETFMVMFQRGQVAALKTWLASAGDAIPAGSAGIVGNSVENWQDWIEVNAQAISKDWTTGGRAEQIIKALHIQSMVWHSVLVGDPQTSGAPSMSAWLQASSAVVRAARTVTVSVLRRFWWLLLLVAAVIAAVLALVIVNLHGASQVWTSILWVGGSVGISGAGLLSTVGKALSGVGSEVWVAARADALAWNVTWLPTLEQSRSQRRSLDRAGLAMPELNPDLEAVAVPAELTLRPGGAPAPRSPTPGA
jgi:nitroreductase